MASKDKATPSELMVVNDLTGDECRIAILQDGHLEELYAENAASATKVSNIYKGRVTNVEPAIQAAFVDFGHGASGFLHITDLHPRYFPSGDRTERVGKRIPRRERPPIQQALRRGDEVLVQVLKEGIGSKGPTLTSYLSIPGRFLVMMPGMDRVGVSRKVEDEDVRRKMRQILDSLDLPDQFGFILRTAGFGANKTDLKRDVAYLSRLWKVMEDRREKVGAPCELYTESDLLVRTLRDVMRPSIKAIVVDSESAYQRAEAFLSVVAPRSAPPLVLYRRQAPIFHAFDIERQIELIHSREVPLPSGGALVIEQTEALVAIDVNSGKSTSARDSETNAYQTNCEAVDEISRQLRLRDLGGLIINDLIDMRNSRNRRKIEDRFRDNLKRDRAKSTVLRISEFGIVEMTRQRMRPSLRKAHFMACPQCSGHGEIKMPESVGADATRQLGFLLQFDKIERVELVCSPRVASVLLSEKRREVQRLEDVTGKKIDVRVSDSIATDRIDVYAYDQRNADIDVRRLPTLKPPTLDELLAEDAEDDVIEADGTKGKRRRRRRRRKPGPADATAIVLSDFPEIEEEDEAEEKPSRSRKKTRRKSKTKTKAESTKTAAEEKPAGKKKTRRGGRKKTDETPVEPAVTETPAPAPATVTAIRVHQLAKQLGVKSGEIVARCRDESMTAIRGHMSRVPEECLEAIRSWYSETTGADEAELETETDAVEDAAPTKEKKRRPASRRSRRGGRRRRKDKSTDAVASDEPAGSEEGDQDAPKKKTRRAAAAKSDTPDAESSTGTRKRRRRRGGAKADDAETPAVEVEVEPVANAAVNGETNEGGESTGRRRRRRRGGRGRRRRSESAPAETVSS